MNCLAQRKKFKNKHPAWSDSSDKAQLQSEGLKDERQDEDEEQHESDVSSDEDDNLDMYANDVRSKKPNLESKVLRYKHLVDINNERSYKGAIKQVRFQPKSKLALVGLSYGEVDLYEIDGERNRYIQNVKLPQTREPFCAFKSSGDTIVISSPNYSGTFYTYDMLSASIKKFSFKTGKTMKKITDFTLAGDFMACRNEGSQEVEILSSKSYENMCSVKINEPVKSVQFFNDNEMFIAGENSQIYIWDMRKASLCKHKFQDEGSIHTTSLAISEKSKLVSIGSDSGITNTYELDQCLQSRFPTPLKTYCNLKTSVDILRYNHSGELLLMGSQAEQKAMRMIHSHSNQVYKNFPSPIKKYAHLLSVDFSPLSGYLALGCSTGRAHLCRISYYKTY